MTTKYPGGFITKTLAAPSSSAASGIWTMDQATQYIQAGMWPGIGISYTFTTFTFTQGWTQTTIDVNSYYSEGAQYSDFSSAYAGATFLPVAGAYAVPFKGIQVLTLPAGTYTFDLYGASQILKSASSPFTNFNNDRAYGARITVPGVVLNGAQKVTIIVGQSGSPAYQSAGIYGTQAGSGATWLFLADGSTLANLTEANLIAVAGGAGGATADAAAGYNANASSNLDGTFNVAASTQDTVGGAARGSGGSGGTGGNRTSNLAAFNPGAGGGGAGVSSNGGRNNTGPTPRDQDGTQPADFTYYGRFVSYTGTTGQYGVNGQGGFAPQNGAQGGLGYDDNRETGNFKGSLYGGFGGGGGGADNVGAGGGGGGYNGGIGGSAFQSGGPLGDGYGPGSGGSSFVATTWRSGATGALRNTFGNGFMVVTKTA